LDPASFGAEDEQVYFYGGLFFFLLWFLFSEPYRTFLFFSVFTALRRQNIACSACAFCDKGYQTLPTLIT
jgi:hypothetical protein